VRAEEPEEEDAQTPTEKCGYSVLNPTPRQFMREFATDRPDQTESPYTVDAGHFQLEMDFANWTSDQERSNRVDEWTREWGIAPLNLKLGLLNNIDIQSVIDNYVHLRIEDRLTRTVEKASGFGDVLTRLKVNLWGNDGGRTAFGIMPIIKWPLPESGLRNGKTDGGIIFPFAAELPAGWDMGAMTEFDFIHNSLTSSYHTEFVDSITFGHAIIGKLHGYLEFFSNVSTEHASDWIGTVDCGLTYLLAENIQLDAGSNFGVTDAAYNINAFSGISVRF
jgi:Putative MetA-pathway of phenol degradation